VGRCSPHHGEITSIMGDALAHVGWHMIYGGMTVGSHT